MQHYASTLPRGRFVSEGPRERVAGSWGVYDAYLRSVSGRASKRDTAPKLRGTHLWLRVERDRRCRRSGRRTAGLDANWRRLPLTLTSWSDLTLTSASAQHRHSRGHRRAAGSRVLFDVGPPGARQRGGAAARPTPPTTPVHRLLPATQAELASRLSLAAAGPKTTAAGSADAAPADRVDGFAYFGAASDLEHSVAGRFSLSRAEDAEDEMGI